MKFKELLLPISFRKDRIITAILCLSLFLSGCSTEEKKPSEQDNYKSKSTEALMPKALHDDLMSEAEASFQGLMRINQSVKEERDKLLEERDKLLEELVKIEELKLALAAAQAEQKQIVAQAQDYQKSSQAAASTQGAASTQTIRQLTVRNAQLSNDLTTSKQRVAQLELSVSRMQNPATILKIRQLYLEKEFLSRELTNREQKIQELQTSVTTSKHQENLNTIRQLKSKNTSLSQSLAKSEKRLKDLQAVKDKPGRSVDPNEINDLKSQIAKLSAERNKLKKQLANLAARPKDSVKTLAEWSALLRSKGLLNIKPTAAQLGSSIGKPHDKEEQTASGDGDEATFIWNDSVKVDLEIRTIDGKIEKITYGK